MKTTKFRRIISAILATAVLAFSIPAGIIASAEDVDYNLGFEGGLWSATGGGSVGDGSEWTVDTTEGSFVEGAQSMKAPVVNATSQVNQQFTYVPIDPAKTYTLRCWVKTEGLANGEFASIKARFVNSNKGIINTAATNYKNGWYQNNNSPDLVKLTGTNAGAYYEWTITGMSTLTNAAYIKIYCNFSTNGGTGCVWFDDFSFTEQAVNPPISSAATGTVFTQSTTVMLSTASTGAEIRYTTDGTAPTAQSALYTDGITVDRDMTVKAVSVLSGNVSDAASFDYYYTPANGSILNNGGFEAGNIGTNFWESASWQKDSAEKRSGNYSAKGTATSEEIFMSSTKYSVDTANYYYSLSVWYKTEGITAEDGFSIQVRLEKPNASGSVVTRYYGNPTGGPYKMFADSGTKGEWTHYTIMLDKMESYLSGTTAVKVYVRLDANCGGAAWIDDVTLTPVRTPVLSASMVNNYVITEETEFTLTSSEPASIYYTTDGTVPTAASTPYTTPIMISADTLIKAVAISPNGIASPVISRQVYFNSDGDVVRNSGFEDGGNGWTLNSGWELDGDASHSGANSVKGTAGTEARYIMSGYVYINPAEKSYELSVWVRTDGIATPDGLSIRVISSDWYGGAGKPLYVAGGTQDWTQYKIILDNFSPSVERIRLYAYLDANCGGTAWVDDFEVRAVADIGNNGGFEDGLWDGNGISEETDTAKVKFGTRSLKAVADEGFTAYKYIPVDPDSVYTLTVWMKSDSLTANAGFSVYECTDNSGTGGERLLGNGRFEPVPDNMNGFTKSITGNTEWTSYKVRLRGFAATTGYIKVVLSGEQGTGSIWYDGITVVKKGVHGDVNGDSSTNVLDLVRMKKSIANAYGTVMADINFSGTADSADAVVLKKILLSR